MDGDVTIRAEGDGAVAARTMRDVHVHLPARGAVAWPHVVGVIPPRAGAFQDRAERARLREAAPCQVLSGMGGVGKTQLAADLAEEVLRQQGVDLLVWLSAGSRTAIVAGLAQAGAEVCGADPSDPEQATRTFLAWLRAGPRRWLVVLDDIADPADVKGLWPPAVEHGRTVVTTRRRDAALAGNGRRVVQVGTFTAAEAATYLASALEEAGRAEPTAELASLADELGCLPLALSQAAAYVVDAGIPVAKYRDLLARRVRTLEDVSPDVLPDDQPHTMAAAWQLSVERADALRPYGLARPMLELASFLAPSIPAAVLTSEPSLAHLTVQRTQPVTADDAAGALRALHRLSLLTAPGPDDDEGYVRVHQIVRRATRERLADGRYGETARAAADALMAVWPSIERDTALAQALRACATALITCTEEGAEHPPCLFVPNAHPLLHHLGLSLGESGQPAAALAHLRRLADATARHLAPDHPDTLVARVNAAQWQGRSGDALGAAGALTELLDDMVRVFGPKHRDTLTAFANAAFWLGSAGDFAGAAADFADLLADMLRILGPDHPDTLTARANLARWQGQAGDAAGAAATYGDVVEDMTRTLGPDHPNTLTARNNHAYFRGEAGDAAGAATACAELLADRLRVLGPDHPETLATCANLAYWLAGAGELAQAMFTYTELLDDQLRILGPDHPDTLTTRGNLVSWRAVVGDLTGAVAAQAALLGDLERTLGPRHPSSLQASRILTLLQERAGKSRA
ncbi:FxSxx-COOH system tetratricopeptide repeat protein [Streptomyces sp. NPDC021020]|uniref:FxSxx-COOH system tetratricopeptide repeat protein n=1 Tax=Streptomyces sp. NPDC021020 TaxID=3365109 RepID=UPI0037996DCC